MARESFDTIVTSDVTDPAPGPRPQHPVLLVLTGFQKGLVFQLIEGENSIGRAGESTLALEDEGISRNHAKVIRAGLDVRVEDCGSTNGTNVNMVPVRDVAHPLRDGDLVYLGKTVVMKFTFQDPLEHGVQQQLYDAAVQDALTQTYNRGYLVERFHQEFAFATRHQRPLCVVMIDLDHFKQVNDRYGHAAGDVTLQRVAAFVKQRIRREDVFARYGGEEFVLLMRETDITQGAILAERIRTGISLMPIEHGEHQFNVTVSVGVSGTGVAVFGSSMEMFIRVDQLLYRAKAQGRNRVIVDS